jgi:triphosphoribosyl-dephospho-CoA synthase
MNTAIALDVQEAPPAAPTPRILDLGELATSAVQCLLLELETFPKPGLVSHIDCGSHVDMDANLFRVSAAAIEPYFHSLADAGARGCGMGRLRMIGIDAEAAMLAATSGVNTHRGVIFGLGLLCAAAGARACGRVNPNLSLGAAVSLLWGADILDGPQSLDSHGGRAHRRFGAGGARLEAAQGFPSVYRVGLASLRKATLSTPNDDEAARVEACFALIAALEDTNLLYRGGLYGLRFAQRAARAFIDRGGVSATGWRAHARTVHESFVARSLSPGGSADLLAMTLFIDTNDMRPW